jgi:hypothetical protein
MPVAPTVALVLLLLQVPPAVADDSEVVLPAHSVDVPVIEAGTALTDISLLVLQPVPSVYTIVAVPVVIPVTFPVAASIAAVVARLLHAPPVVADSSVVELPSQTWAAPVIVAGAVFTDTVCVL